jgi:hypothetical protein
LIAKKLKETHEGNNIPQFVEIKQEPQQIPIIIEPPPIPEPIATSASPKPLDAVIPTQPATAPTANIEQPIVQQITPVPRVEQPQNRILSSEEEKELLEQLQNQEKSNPVLARFRRKLAIRQVLLYRPYSTFYILFFGSIVTLDRSSANLFASNNLIYYLHSIASLD